MIKDVKNGFILIIVTVFLALLIIIVCVVVGLGCGEIMHTKINSDSNAAYYVAVAGAEIMYAHMKSQEGRTITWPQSVPSASSVVRTLPSGGTVVGTFIATANIVASNVFGIVSEGNVNGRRSTVTVKYGFDSPFTNGYPISSIGPMSLAGHKLLGMRSWVRAEGPIASGSTVTTNNFVKVSGDILQNQPFVPPSFWWKYNETTGTWTEKITYDADGDGQYLTDTNDDNKITIDDAEGDSAKIDIFNADNTYSSDTEINDKDAFYTYYTSELNKAENLGVAPGESNYYATSQEFDPLSVPAGTRMVFVDGDVDMLFSDTEWWGVDCNHTVVSTGDITIYQPTNGADDTLCLVAYGDVNTGGLRAFGGVRGNFVVYAKDDFNAYYGGRTNGTIFAEGNVDIDTVDPIPGLLNRDLNRATSDWADPDNLPLGLPRGYNILSLSFRILNEDTEYKPKWQRI